MQVRLAAVIRETFCGMIYRYNVQEFQIQRRDFFTKTPCVGDHHRAATSDLTDIVVQELRNALGPLQLEQTPRHCTMPGSGTLKQVPQVLWHDHPQLDTF